MGRLVRRIKNREVHGKLSVSMGAFLDCLEHLVDFFIYQTKLKKKTVLHADITFSDDQQFEPLIRL